MTTSPKTDFIDLCNNYKRDTECREIFDDISTPTFESIRKDRNKLVELFCLAFSVAFAIFVLLQFFGVFKLA